LLTMLLTSYVQDQRAGRVGAAGLVCHAMLVPLSLPAKPGPRLQLGRRRLGGSRAGRAQPRVARAEGDSEKVHPSCTPVLPLFPARAANPAPGQMQTVYSNTTRRLDSLLPCARTVDVCSARCLPRGDTGTEGGHAAQARLRAPTPKGAAGRHCSSLSVASLAAQVFQLFSQVNGLLSGQCSRMSRHTSSSASS